MHFVDWLGFFALPAFFAILLGVVASLYNGRQDRDNALMLAIAQDPDVEGRWMARWGRGFPDPIPRRRWWERQSRRERRAARLDLERETSSQGSRSVEEEGQSIASGSVAGGDAPVPRPAPAYRLNTFRSIRHSNPSGLRDDRELPSRQFGNTTVAGPSVSTTEEQRPEQPLVTTDDRRVAASEHSSDRRGHLHH